MTGGSLSDSDDVYVTNLEDRHRAIQTLAVAFYADPVLRFCYPDSVRYFAHFPNFAEAFGGKAFTYGSAYHFGEHLGTALWLPPDIFPDEESVVEHFEQTLNAATLKTAVTVLNQMGTFHPKEPHWYLALIGVDLSHQGKGIGTKLMQQMTNKFDREENLAYLESTNAANIPLYERFGFSSLGRIQVGNCPPLFPMVRRPQVSGYPNR